MLSRDQVPTLFGLDSLLEALKKLLDGDGAVFADQFTLADEADCSCEDFVKVKNYCSFDSFTVSDSTLQRDTAADSQQCRSVSNTDSKWESSKTL